MISGMTSKLSENTQASAATVSVGSDIVLLTGTTGVATLLPNFGGGFSGKVTLVALDGAVALANTGNISVAASVPQNKSVTLVYSATKGKWYPQDIGT